MNRDAFRARGHDAWSVDLQSADDGSPHHLQTDVLDILDDGWDLMISHIGDWYTLPDGGLAQLRGIYHQRRLRGIYHQRRLTT